MRFLQILVNLLYSSWKPEPKARYSIENSRDLEKRK